MRYEVFVEKYLMDNGVRRKFLERQPIINGVSGYAMPGQTLYIMGSSGAGKTSLLNILSDRISSKGGSRIGGKIMLNDALPLTQKIFGKIGGYVMQDDILF